VDQSGSLDGTEAVAFCRWVLEEVQRSKGKSIAALNPPELADESTMLLKEIDHSGNGSISFPEFEKYWKKLEP